MGTDLTEQYDPAVSPNTRHIGGFFPIYKLFKNDFTPDADSVEADFTEADFSGYSSQNPTWNIVKNPTDERFEHERGVAKFVHDGGATANTIYGWYAIDTKAMDVNGTEITDVVAHERFAAPIVMSEDSDTIPVHLHKHAAGVDS